MIKLKLFSQSNKMQKSRLFLIIIALFTIAMTVISSFTVAWLVNAKMTDPLNFSVAHIDSIIYIYKGVDFDFDGNLDLSDNMNMFGGYEKFEFLPRKVIDDVEQDYLDITNAFPTKIYTFAVDVYNNGNREGEVVISFKDYFSEENQTALKLLSFSVKEYGDENFGEKVYFSDITEDNVLPILGTEGVVSEDGIFVQVNTSRCFLLRIEVETFENLVSAGVDITESEYQNAQASLITLPSLSVVLQTHSIVES